MVEILIGLIWVVIIALVCAVVIWLLLYAVKIFLPIPPKVEQVIWVIFGLLVLIYVLTVFAGGGGGFPHPAMFHR
jgi:hypothetical protein